MTSSASEDNDSLTSLRSAVETSLNLISQIQATTEKSRNTLEKAQENTQENALDLAHDTAALIRAQSTKLSLLITNKPFTASAITKVLRELVAGPIPGLALAVERCHAAQYTKAMSEEVRWHARKVLRELGLLIASIPLNGQTLSDVSKLGTGNIGVVWQACDGVMELKKIGVAGILIRKADEYRDLIEDALWELQEWGEEGSDADDDSGIGSGGEDDAQATLDDMFGAQQHIPSDDADRIRPRLESSKKRLRLIITMYKAIVKRRFKTMPKLPRLDLSVEPKAGGHEDPGIVDTLDKVVDSIKKIPEVTDELATAFYGLDGKEVDKWMDECFMAGSATAELLIRDWKGQQDEFSAWATKFQSAMKGRLVVCSACSSSLSPLDAHMIEHPNGQLTRQSQA